jgi:hypothetical protein
MTSLTLFISLTSLSSVRSIECAAEYDCFEDPNEDLIWVRKVDANVLYGPTCSDQCEQALSQNTDFYACDGDRRAFKNDSDFQYVADGLGITCTGYTCWEEAPGTGLVLTTGGAAGEKHCWYPAEDTFSCHTAPGNANCFNERFSPICPCVPKPLDEACVWDAPPNNPRVANWDDIEDGTTCLARINYWRKKACEDGWVECPPAGLPPMTECVCCHECANSEALYDSENGAHSSFQRCGEMVQGEGGGSTCANVIDSFISERAADADGVMRCTGHCGPIVKQGCQTFHWGRTDGGFHTLNWRACNTDKCQGYCENPNSNECFQLADESLRPDTQCCDADGAEDCPWAVEEDNDNGKSGSGSSGSNSDDGVAIGVSVSVSLLVLAAAIGGGYYYWYYVKPKQTMKEARATSPRMVGGAATAKSAHVSATGAAEGEGQSGKTSAFSFPSKSSGKPSGGPPKPPVTSSAAGGPPPRPGKPTGRPSGQRAPRKWPPT